MTEGARATLLRAHPWLAAVLAAAVLLRLAVAIGYEPALFFSDSWSYVRLAYSPGFANDRPSGYPLLIALLSLPGREPAVLTAAQHLAGLATGVLAYALLVRLGVGRGLAAAAAAAVLLDGYAIALEQFVMAEAFFTLALLLALVLTIESSRHRPAQTLALGGLLLGGAATLRTLGLFAIPAFVAYVLWIHRDRRLWALALGAALAPVLAYSAVHAAAGKGFGMTQIDGWALYSRVAPFADCDGADVPADTRPLCQPSAERRDEPSYYGWSSDSPANRLYGSRKVEGNPRLRAFGAAIVRHQPLDYAAAVGGDFLRFFRPGGGGAEGATAGGFDEPVILPEPGDGEFGNEFSAAVRAEYFPRYRRDVDPPAGIARAWQSVFHTSRPLLGVLALAALASLVLRMPHRREILLLAGAALLMLLGAASVEFQVRYLVPAVPLLVCAGVLGGSDLAAGRKRHPA